MSSEYYGKKCFGPEAQRSAGAQAVLLQRWVESRDAGNPDYAARDELVMSLGLIAYKVAQPYRRYPHIKDRMDELASAGVERLITMIDGYDPSKAQGSSIATYVFSSLNWFVRNTLKDELGSVVHNAHKAEGQRGSDQRLSDISLEAPTSSDPGERQTFLDTLSAEGLTQFDAAVRTEERSMVQEALQKLTPRERFMVIHRTMMGEGRDEVAAQWAEVSADGRTLSGQRVDQITNEALYQVFRRLGGKAEIFPLHLPRKSSSFRGGPVVTALACRHDPAKATAQPQAAPA